MIEKQDISALLQLSNCLGQVNKLVVEGCSELGPAMHLNNHVSQSE